MGGPDYFYVGQAIVKGTLRFRLRDHTPAIGAMRLPQGDAGLLWVRGDSFQGPCCRYEGQAFVRVHWLGRAIVTSLRTASLDTIDPYTTVVRHTIITVRFRQVLQKYRASSPQHAHGTSSLTAQQGSLISARSCSRGRKSTPKVVW